MLVVGQHPGAVAQVAKDLEGLGFTVVQRNRMDQVLDNFDVGGGQIGWEARLVHTAFASGAELVVLVDVGGGLMSPSVIVKAIEVESGALLWSGDVSRTEPVSERDYQSIIMALSHEAVMDGLIKPSHSR